MMLFAAAMPVGNVCDTSAKESKVWNGSKKVEQDSVEAVVEVKDKADEDSYEALQLSPPTAEEERCLRDQFGLKHFKPLQWRIISSVMKERADQCVIISTGYGKSLCYQFQAVYQVNQYNQNQSSFSEPEVNVIKMENGPCFGTFQNLQRLILRLNFTL